ncbi:MAG: DUF1045 domain-containing protein [Roseovarius sp.]|nr:DUF1045 domain-containing protein [Roseovarius sp.]
MTPARYAIYVTPPPGPLAAFGAAWLGWDAAQGATVPHPDIPGLPAPIADLTEAPRKYGLHATMKPPFALAPGQTEATLRDAFARFCAHTAPVTLDGLAVAPLGRFLALLPEGDQTAISALAADCVRAFEPFRAPLTEAERARRRAGGLTPDQEARLARWGYPHVMAGFRFHITLTGKRPKAELPALQTTLAAHLAPILPRPLPVDALSLMAEDAEGRFHLLHRHALTG